MAANLKFVFVGDGATGKTCLCITSVGLDFPDEYIPTVFDNYVHQLKVDGQEIQCGLWDTAGPEDYDRLRPLSYPQTDAFMVCFSTVNPASYENVVLKWIPEVRHHIPDAFIVLVGTKIDLRHDETVLQRLEQYRMTPKTTVDGLKLAAEINADAYCETSSKCRMGVDKLLFNVATLVRSQHRQRAPKTKNFFSKLLSGNLNFLSGPTTPQQLGFELKETNASAGVRKAQQKAVKKSPSGPLAPYTLRTKAINAGTLTPVYAHSCLVYKNIIHLIGGCGPDGRGIDDILRYHTADRKLLRAVKREGNSKGSHFHCSTLYRDELFIFGGRCNSYTNQVTKLSLGDEKWASVSVLGQPPSPRYGATGVRCKDLFFIFAGYDDFGMVCDDLHVLSLTSATWTQIKPTTTTKPPHRKHHTAVIIKDKHLSSWSSPTSPSNSSDGGSGIVLNTTTTTTTTITSTTTTTTTTEAKMIVFGGMDGKGKGMNDLWQFDLKTQQWTLLATKGRQPGPLYGHVAFANKEGFMFVSGGFKSEKKRPSSAFYCLDLRELTWHKMKAKIPPRFFHSVCELTPDFFFLAGGKGPESSFSDVYEVELIPQRSFFSQSQQKGALSAGSLPYQVLGKDLWACIFHFLTWKDLLACDRVCKYFWMLSHSERLWEGILYLHHPELKEQHEEEKKHCSIPLTGFRASFVSKQPQYQAYIWNEKNPWGKEYKNSELFWISNKHVK